MKRSVRNKYAMYNAMKQYLAESNEIWKENSGFNANVEKFNDLFDKVKDILQDLRVDSGPTTVRKHANLESLTRKAMTLQGVLRSLALEIKDQEFDARLKMTISDLKHGAVLQRILNFKHLADMADERLEELAKFNWTKEVHENFREMLDNADKQLAAPVSRRRDMKNQRQELKIVFTEMDQFLNAMDLIIYAFEEEHPTFVSRWQDSRSIVNYRSKSNAADNNGEVIDELFGPNRDENIPDDETDDPSMEG